MWQKRHRTKSTAPTTALDTLSFWLYNTLIQTGAQDEDHYQSPQKAQRAHRVVLCGHTLQAEGSAE